MFAANVLMSRSLFCMIDETAFSWGFFFSFLATVTQWCQDHHDHLFYLKKKKKTGLIRTIKVCVAALRKVLRTAERARHCR